MTKLILKLRLILYLTIIVSTPLLSQSGTGKLSGKIIDADTKEALIGANIVLLNTELGSATNVEGKYFILNITPGTYDVRVSYVGYTPQLIKDVRIVAGITYELNAELTSGLVTQEIVITNKKFFEEKATNTVKVVDANEISKLPVKGIENVASLQAGVVKEPGSGGESGNAELNVRGGRNNEVLYIIDGIPQNDIFTGMNYSQVSNAAVEQISFQIGGYEAKYGQAQSGVVNVTTKRGQKAYSLYGEALTSEYTDAYGSNTYTLNIGGPFYPGLDKHTFFISAERGWFLDAAPSAIETKFPSIGYSSKTTRNNSSDVWRYSATTNHNLDKFVLRLSANINERNFRDYDHFNAKSNSDRMGKYKRDNYSFSGKISHNFSSNSFWNLNLGYKIFKQERGDGVFFDKVELYGDKAENAKYGYELPANGVQPPADEYGIFNSKGQIYNIYSKRENNNLTADFDFTSQLKDNLFEFGGGVNYGIVRYFEIRPRILASDNLRDLSIEEKYSRADAMSYGYDITGKSKTSKGDKYEPRYPLFSYAYVQDRIELSDMVINLGLRLDYFDSQNDKIKNLSVPFAGGTNPKGFDAEDFERAKPEFFISPRIGLGFPVTDHTVFHAQYGKFIQAPSLNEVYNSVDGAFGFKGLTNENFKNRSINTGTVKSEETTQYEIGLRQVLGDVAALNITAFYKNTVGLINDQTFVFQKNIGGEELRAISPTNSDFGTIKGLALSLDITRIGYFSLSADYTYSIAEGTGSSTSSSFTAAFRNDDGEVPKVIAPLDFDQRHTGIVNIDFTVPKGELGVFEMVNANILVSFASGRPYTPIAYQDLVQGYTNWGETKGYVNSAYGPGTFSINLKVEKTFDLGFGQISPYLLIENLLDADNPQEVYEATGNPYSSGWLSTETAKKYAASLKNPQGYIDDYKALEMDPSRFGPPRLIKLGLKVNLSNIQL